MPLCRCDTVRTPQPPGFIGMRCTIILALATLALALDAFAQAPAWTRVGSNGVEVGLSGPAGAPIGQAAFTLDSSALIVRTADARRWLSLDRGDTWTLVPAAETPAVTRPEVDSDVLPPAAEPDARVLRHPASAGRLYALGDGLYVSYDDGESWTTLASDGEIVGGPQIDLAFDPLEAERLFLANAHGLWRSEDGGLSWTSLNGNLPNFPRARFAAAELTLAAPRLGKFELAGDGWTRLPKKLETPVLPLLDRIRTASPPVAAPEGVLVSFRVWKDGRVVSPDLTLCGERDECGPRQFRLISAFAAVGATMLAGTSDGRVWISHSDGQSWQRALAGLPAPDAGRGVAAVWIDPETPLTAAVVFSGSVGGRVFRSVDGGLIWDDVTADLPPGSMTAVTGAARSSALYVAGLGGAFYAPTNLREPAPPGSWSSIGDSLPGDSVRDLRLDGRTGRLYAALDGFGVFETRAPGVVERLRLLNAADLSRRPAAPGGLLTVQGVAVSSARVNGINAPVLAATPSESQIQAPYQARGRAVTVELSYPEGAEELSYPFDDVSPAIFVDRGEPFVMDAATGQLLDLRNPARAGARLLVLAAGLGQVRPPWPAGVPAPLDDPPVAEAPVTAYLNGEPLTVISATLAGGYIGAYLVELELPMLLTAGSAELRIEAAGRSSNSVRLFLEP